MPIPAAFDLSGRVAMITGAGSPGRIGFATARLLADLGAAVMISATTARVHDRVSELRGAFLVTKAALPAMTSRGWGRIIMVASVTGPVMAIRPTPVTPPPKQASPAPPPSTPPGTESPSTPSPRLDSNRLPNPARA